MESSHYVPYIGKRLGVDIGEPFIIKGYDSVVYKLLADGTFITEPENVIGSSLNLLRAVENGSGSIEKVKKYSVVEMTFIKEVCGEYIPTVDNIKMIKIDRNKVVVVSYNCDNDNFNSRIAIFPDGLFTDIRVGECVNLITAMQYNT